MKQILIICLILGLTLVGASIESKVGIDLNKKYIVSANDSTSSANDTQYFQSYTPSTLWSYYTTLADLLYYPLNSNPKNYLNTTTLPSAETDPKWTGNKSSYIPYTGATTHVSLGVNRITSNGSSSSYIILDGYSTMSTINYNVKIDNQSIRFDYGIQPQIPFRITSSSGNISFDNENLNTTGNFSSNMIKMNPLGVVCPLNINGSICSNATGTYIVG